MYSNSQDLLGKAEYWRAWFDTCTKGMWSSQRLHEHQQVRIAKIPLGSRYEAKKNFVKLSGFLDIREKLKNITKLPRTTLHN